MAATGGISNKEYRTMNDEGANFEIQHSLFNF